MNSFKKEAYNIFCINVNYYIAIRNVVVLYYLHITEYVHHI